jgi:hypothetical protein
MDEMEPLEQVTDASRRQLGDDGDENEDEDEVDPDDLTDHELEHFQAEGYRKKQLPVALRSGTAAHVFGCPMRSLFQITDQFYQLQVAWIHNQQSGVHTVAQVRELIQSYFTISIHFRIGDSSFKTDGVSFKRR